jgi:predicted peptidase
MKIKYAWLPLFSLIVTLAQAQQPAAPAAQVDQTPKPNPAAPMYRATGEQYRIYEFPGTGESIPYRLYVPEDWQPGEKLPMLITLRAGNSINNNHRESNALVTEARKRRYIVVSPLGYRGYRQPYYGSPYPVERPDGPSKPADGWTAEDNQRAEQDVLNVLAVVAAEYNADTSRVFLHGQNPSGSAAMHFAAKYPDTFSAIVVSSGPIITTNYPFANLEDKVAVLVLHGDKDTSNPIAASERMARELKEHGIETEYQIVPGGEHLNAYLLFAPQLYDFLDRH